MIPVFASSTSWHRIPLEFATNLFASCSDARRDADANSNLSMNLSEQSFPSALPCLMEISLLCVIVCLALLRTGLAPCTLHLLLTCEFQE